MARDRHGEHQVDRLAVAGLEVDRFAQPQERAARTNAFDRARGAFLRLREPVDFEAGDGQPVDLVLAMAVPRHFEREHLRILSDLAARFSDATFRAALRGAGDIAALRELLLVPAAVTG